MKHNPQNTEGLSDLESIFGIELNSFPAGRAALAAEAEAFLAHGEPRAHDPAAATAAPDMFSVDSAKLPPPLRALIRRLPEGWQRDERTFPLAEEINTAVEALLPAALRPLYYASIDNDLSITVAKK